MATKAMQRFSAPKVKYRTRVVQVAKRGASIAARHARAEKESLQGIGGALLLGLAVRQGIKLPAIAGLSGVTTVALGAWALGKVTRNPLIRGISNGMLAAALFEATAHGDGATSTEGDVSGEMDIE